MSGTTRSITSAVLCALALAAPAARAAWIPGVVVVCGAAGSQYRPTVIADGAGGAIVPWYDQRGTATDIYVQRLGATGDAQWAADGVGLCTATGWQQYPVGIPDGAGGAIIVWDDQRGADYDIYAQRVNAAGVAQWAANGVVICAAAGDQRSPQIVADGAGGALIAWHDRRSGNYDVYAQRLSAAGAVQWAANGVALCVATGIQQYPRITGDGAGGAIVAWDDYRSGDSDVYVQRVNAAGAVQWAANGVVLVTATGLQWYCRIASDGAGGAIVTWSDSRSGNYDIYAQRVQTSGAVSWAANGVAICAAAGTQRYPRLAPSGAGGAIIVWEDMRGGVNYDIYAQLVTAAGAVAWAGDGIAICAAAADQLNPVPVSDNAGGSIVAWDDGRDGAGNDIYVQRVNSSGAVLWAADGDALTSGTVNHTYPEIGTDGAHGAIVAWQALRDGTLDILSQVTGRLVNSGLAFEGVSDSSVDWGDYDNDGDLDVLLTGSIDAAPYRRTQLYRNDGGTFTAVTTGLPNLGGASTDWGDYDNDGDLDLLLAGDTGFGIVSRVYRNDGGVFTDIGAGLPGVWGAALAWGDYDNDGDLDFVLTGGTAALPPYGPLSRIYRNDGGTFTATSAGLVDVCDGAAAWGDYDHDGDLDLFLAGAGLDGYGVAKIYRNDGVGVLTDVDAPLTGVVDPCGAAWGDYDSDGDLDLALTGFWYTGSATRIYRNDLGEFVDAGAGLPDVPGTVVAWGDYDNDGDPDLLLAGGDNLGNSLARIYRNDGGAFTDISAGLPAVVMAAAAWGDCDNDGDLDLLLTGQAGAVSIAQLWLNDALVANAPPPAPTNAYATPFSAASTSAWFHWTAPVDDHTPANGLQYNLRIGTTPGGQEVMPAMAAVPGGYRRVAVAGKVVQWTACWIRLPAPGRYYWSVQAIDGAFAGSAFTTEGVVDVQNFTEAATALPPVGDYSATEWGDYDNDGDLDILLAGDGGAKVCRNDGGAGPVFTDIGAALGGGACSAAAWGDYDNDGDLDIVLVCQDFGPSPGTRVYRNDGAPDWAFTDAGIALAGVSVGDVAWGDCDNDGDLDLLVTGQTLAGAALARVYLNDGGANPAFTDAGAALPGVFDGSASWADYDRDGDLDILLVGSISNEAGIAKVYRNGGGAHPTFTDSGATLTGVLAASAAWGDYNNDGFPDILLTGTVFEAGQSFPFSELYRNSGGETPTFVPVWGGIQGSVEQIQAGAVAWGDYDNDGNLDFLLAGLNYGGARFAAVYRNSGGPNWSFANVNAPLTGVMLGSASWGDDDGDGDLDLLLTGSQWNTDPVTKLYRNDGAPPNGAPTAPGGLWSALAEDRMVMNWNAATDAQTPAAALTYNLRVGSTPGGGDIFSGMASATDGYRRVARTGNAQQRLSWSVALPPPVGPYYWSVQAIDGAYAGGPFAAEQSFSPPTEVRDGATPREFALQANVPNPFNPATTIRFSIPRTERVRLVVHDLTGRAVRVLLDETRPAGTYEARWHGDDGHGRPLASGLYFCRMEAGAFRETRRMTLVR